MYELAEYVLVDDYDDVIYTTNDLEEAKKYRAQWLENMVSPGSQVAIYERIAI